MNAKYALFAILLTCISCTLGCNRSDLRLLETERKGLKVFEEFRSQPQTLQAIQERSKLRAITYFNAMGYFISEANEKGFDYSLASEFAEWLGVELEIVIPPSRAAAADWLHDGGGDLIIMPYRMDDELTESFAISLPYQQTYEAIVGWKEGRSIANLSELAGETVYAIRFSEAHKNLAKQIGEQSLPIKLTLLSEDHVDDELLTLLKNGTANYIAIDGKFAESTTRYHYKNYKVALRLNPDAPVGWLLPKESDKLKARLDQFLTVHYKWKPEVTAETTEVKRSAYYNMTYKRYFENPKLARFFTATPDAASLQANISSYDPLVRRIASEYGLDWRLLLAVIFEESRFDAQALSHAGAMGLMQLMPETFASLGFAKIWDTEENIRAGATYLKRLLRSYESSNLKDEEKIRLVIASYNAGRNHLEDARKLAVSMGWQGDSWHGGIKQALRLLTDERYYSKVTYGYCRGSETTQYVHRIMDRYSLFKKVLAL